jgi:hypothetical protein
LAIRYRRIGVTVGGTAFSGDSCGRDTEGVFFHGMEGHLVLLQTIGFVEVVEVVKR